MLDVYNKLLQCTATFNSGSGFPASPNMNIVANNVATAGTCSLQVQFSAPTGTSGAPAATDPASGEVLHISFTFKNSSV